MLPGTHTLCRHYMCNIIDLIIIRLIEIEIFQFQVPIVSIVQPHSITFRGSEFEYLNRSVAYNVHGCHGWELFQILKPNSDQCILRAQSKYLHLYAFQGLTDHINCKSSYSVSGNNSDVRVYINVLKLSMP